MNLEQQADLIGDFLAWLSDKKNLEIGSIDLNGYFNYPNGDDVDAAILEFVVENEKKNAQA